MFCVSSNIVLVCVFPVAAAPVCLATQLVVLRYISAKGSALYVLLLRPVVGHVSGSVYSFVAPVR